MKTDKYWRTLFIIMWCFIVGSLIMPSFINYKVQDYILYASALGCLVLLILMGIKYLKGAYTRKEYVIRALSLYLPYLPFPVYMYGRILLYYMVNNDNDPLGILWVLQVVPQTLIFILLGGIFVLVTALIPNKKIKEQQ